MDAMHFDNLSRRLGTLETRRGLLRLVSVLPLAGALAVLGDEDGRARRKGKGRRRSHRPGHAKAQRKGERKGNQQRDKPANDRNGCTTDGYNCSGSGDCCSGQCVNRGTGNYCGTCIPNYHSCTADSECCSRQCIDGGCRNPVCQFDSDCPAPKICCHLHLASICQFPCHDGQCYPYYGDCPA
jgi:hypothetical protein